ncbi:MAG: hypothetical protein GY853_11215 [PVC group bacterium]|nr:hypothetical protein [PVC group bacterium]
MSVIDFWKSFEHIKYIYLFGTISLVVFACIFYAWLSKKQTEWQRNVLGRLGLVFVNHLREEMFEELKGFKLFNIGYAKKITYVLTGEMEGISWKIFDYQYSVKSGRRTATYIQTVAYTEFSGLSLPKFLIEPNSFLHKIGDVFKTNDIKLEAFPVFLKRYTLRGKDEVRIKKLFTPQIVDFFEKRNRAVTIEAEGSKIIIYYLKVKIPLPELKDIIVDEAGIVKTFETHCSK